MLGEPELLLRRIPVVELEERGGTVASASEARAAHVGDREKLSPPAMLNDCVTSGTFLDRRMPHAMAVGAEEIALLGLGAEPRSGAAEAAEAKFLGRWFTVVELESCDAVLVTAVLASAATSFYQFELAA